MTSEFRGYIVSRVCDIQDEINKLALSFEEFFFEVHAAQMPSPILPILKEKILEIQRLMNSYRKQLGE